MPPYRPIRAAALAAMLASLAAVRANAQAPVDSSLAAFIAAIRAVDNHTHVNSVAPGDSESDAMPLDGIPPFPSAARNRFDNPEIAAALKTLYGYPYADLADAHLSELRAAEQRVRQEQGTRFPEWALDHIGTGVMLANRVAMGPGLAPPRFRWVSYVDALMLPLSTRGERIQTPDYQKLYPLEEKLLHRYLTDLGLSRIPATLDAYVGRVVTPTLERQRQAGAIAVKFEAAYLRALDFGDGPAAAARRIYARYAAGGRPSHAEYTLLENYLFRVIAREAGRLGMAVHIHAFEGGGGFYRIAGSDPLLLEPALNDSTLRGANFVVVHGGGIFMPHTGALLAKPNVFADLSAMAVIYGAPSLAVTLRPWLEQYPEKVLFGTDAFTLSPEVGWEVVALMGGNTVRQALAIALTGMMRDGEITRPRAEEIATMVMRGNALKLYSLCASGSCP
ncbi:MAG TPA: hypothetical protein VGI92_01255 [Gemmatimonadales bacterium]|jgi:hypothetical protein